MKKLLVRWQIIAMSAFFILVSIFTTYSVIDTLHQQRLDGQVISIAGRQRMLIQKFAKEIFQQQAAGGLGAKLYEKTDQLFSLSLTALIDGGETFADLAMSEPMTIPAINNSNVLEGLSKVEERWQQERSTLLGLVSGRETSSSEVNIRVDQLVGMMNDVVNLLVKASEQKVKVLINEVKILLVITILIGVVLSYLVIVSVTRPLKELDDLSKDFRAGHLDRVVPDNLMDGSNEITSLARSIESMRDKLERLLGSVQGSSLDMKNTAQQVSYISKTIITGSDEQEKKTERVQESVNALTEIADVINQKIEQSAEYVKKSEDKAKKGVVVARQNINELETAVTGVSQASEMIQNLSESADKMHDIVDSIQNIASQTNLLALNAAIEAARAGEQGRGFAVVADEVRTLASRTSSSTDEITQLIEGFSQRVNESVESMSVLVSQVNTIQGHSQETIVSFEAMNQDVINTAASNQQILDYNSQQSIQVEQLSIQFQDLFTALKTNANKADSTSLVAESLYKAAESLRQVVSNYKVRNMTSGSVMNEGDERREQTRFRSNICAKVFAGTKELNAMVEDISIGGCKIILKDSIKDKKVTLTLRIPCEDRSQFESQKPLQVVASVIREERYGMGEQGFRYLYGLKFSDVENEQKEKLEEVIAYCDDIYNDTD